MQYTKVLCGRVVVGSLKQSLPAVFTCDLYFLFLPLPCTLCHFLALEQLLVNCCVNYNLLGSWSRLLFTCTPQWFSFGGFHLACAGQMAWLGATDHTWSWTWPSAFFNPAWTSWSGPSLLPYTVFLMASVPLLCSFPPRRNFVFCL